MSALDRLLQPRPLNHRRLENRLRGIRVVFHQFPPGPCPSEQNRAGHLGCPHRGTSFRYHGRKTSGIFNRADNFRRQIRAGDEFGTLASDFAGMFFDPAFDLITDNAYYAFRSLSARHRRVKINRFICGGAPVHPLGTGMRSMGRLASTMLVPAHAP